MSQSSAYRQWRRQFVRDRLRLSIQIAIAGQLFLDIVDIFIIEPLHQMSEQASTPANDYIHWSAAKESIETLILSSTMLVICLLLLQHPKLHRAPMTLLPVLTFATLIVPEQLYHIQTLQQLDSDFVADIAIVFWAQAILLPVQWRSHLVAQLISISWIAGLLAIDLLAERTRTYSVEALLDGSWIILYCLLIIAVANCMVWYSERLIYHAFSLREQLQNSLKTLSYDLQQPILDSQQRLHQLQEKNLADHIPETDAITIPAYTVQRLLNNSHHQLELLTTLISSAKHHD